MHDGPRQREKLKRQVSRRSSCAPSTADVFSKGPNSERLSHERLVIQTPDVKTAAFGPEAGVRMSTQMGSKQPLPSVTLRTHTRAGFTGPVQGGREHAAARRG